MNKSADGSELIRQLRAGVTLSFSAGGALGVSEKFRVVQHKTRVANILREFPKIGEYLSGPPPVIINAYPATFGGMDSAVFVDTYLRSPTVSAALSLASTSQSTAILIAQPLTAAHFLLEHLSKALRLPERLILVLGGYPCPLSLEKFLKSRLASLENLLILHSYGVAEIDAGLMLGIARTVEGSVVYRGVNSDIGPVVKDGKLAFVVHTDIKQMKVTEESAVVVEGGIVIQNSAKRTHPDVLAMLERWHDKAWERYTGYVMFGESVTLQLRSKVQPVIDYELEHFEFCRRFGASWLDKPDWSMKKEYQPDSPVCQ
jgi:hypothetical protein